MFFASKEQFYKYPGRLTWLCAEALGKFVSSILMKLVMQKQHHHVKEICEHLKHMLHASVPESIVDEMKIRILREYENVYVELSEMFDSEDDYQEIATEIFIAILHPSVTRIECVEYTSHPKLLDGFKMRYSDLIYSAIPKLKNVKAMRLGDASYLNNRHELGEHYDDKISETLEEFRNGMSCNLEIMTLCEQGKKLRILDFGDSLDVYDESVPFILKLDCLEELDVHYTSILSDGLHDLLIGLVNTKHSDGKFASELLKRFVCDGLSQEQVCLVGNKFPNLTSLTLINADCDLSPLKVLKHLKHLDVQVDTYKYLSELLSSIGGQFVCLNLRHIPDTDFYHLSSTCTSLRCLHLNNSPRIKSNVTTAECCKMLPMPEFPQVLSLELRFDDETGLLTQYLMSRFNNVRRLFLSHCCNGSTFEFVLQRSCMKHLEIAFLQKFGLIYIALQFYAKYVVVTDFSKKVLGYSIPVFSYPI